jgi:hypothetical protein
LIGRERGRNFKAVIVGLIVVISGVVLYSFSVRYLQTSIPPPDPIPPVSASDTPPDDIFPVETIHAGSLALTATANATGAIPHQGPMTFRMILVMNITNTGSEDITDFHAVKVSVYNTDNELFYTFGFLYDSNVTIAAGESVSLSYQNSQTRVEFPFEPWFIYARVLVTFNVNREVIVTTPLIEAMFAIE